MVDTKRSTTTPKASPEDASGSPESSSPDLSFADHFGEPQGLQERVVSDQTRIVYRDGVTVLTDAPREGDVPQSAVPGHSAVRTGTENA